MLDISCFEDVIFVLLYYMDYPVVSRDLVLRGI